MGNRGWTYREVLPFFKRMETYEAKVTISFGDRTGRSASPIRNGKTTHCLPKVIEAAGQVGISHNPDYNGARQDGIAMSQATISKGRRMSTAHCYLTPIRNRANLNIVTEALTQELLLDGTRCGVRYTVGGQTREAHAREVIVCGGSINSPQLLELSGIGQPDLLRRHGIERASRLPGVDENLEITLRPERDGRSTRKGYLQRPGAGTGIGPPSAPLHFWRQRDVWNGCRAVACLRAFARRQQHRPPAWLGADAVRSQPAPRISSQSGMTCMPIRCAQRAKGRFISRRPTRRRSRPSISISCRHRSMRN